MRQILDMIGSALSFRLGRVFEASAPMGSLAQQEAPETVPAVDDAMAATLRLRALLDEKMASPDSIWESDLTRISDLAVELAGYFPHPVSVLSNAMVAQSFVEGISPAHGLDLAIRLHARLKEVAPGLQSSRTELLRTISKLAGGEDPDLADVRASAAEFISHNSTEILLARMSGIDLPLPPALKLP